MTLETEKTLKRLYRYYSYVQLNVQSLLLTSPTLAISKLVLTLLSEKINDQEQYSRRPCLVFEGMNNVDEDNKELSQEIANIVRNELNVKITGDDVDKSHPINKTKENKYIVKFTKHSTAETIYKQRKKLTKKKKGKINPPIKIKVSLTRRRQKLLEYATKVTHDYSLIRFIYTDINGNIKIHLKEPISNR